MPIYFQKPENALKRANEFIDVGKKDAALDILYDVIKSKKHRNWQKIHEPILRKYLELCVDLKRSVNAKEGLYQYKLICQQVNPVSLEEVIAYFLKLAEKMADDAKNQSIEQVTVEDLDAVQTPEGILLSSVSTEDAQDRSDRVLLTPWVKFLWEAYRNVLELLRNNNRVEHLYHDTAQNAFKFCLKYNRRAEFRKLCTLVKNHLDQVLKYQGQPTAINLNNPESLQMNLETRLFQLENAISMELWQEAFRAIEGIHYLMSLSKKPPKPHMMANYFGKVALVFLKAENHTFHAATLFKLFNLIKEQKKSVTSDELQKIGSKVLLATLSVPIPPGQSSMEEYLSYNTVQYEKEKKLASLVGDISIPTRKSLIKDLQAILPFLSKELQDLYHNIEETFQPTKLCKNVHEALASVQEIEDFAPYTKNIQEIAVVRMLKQVSQIYETIAFDQILKMVPFMSAHQLEHVIVESVKRGEMHITIDHRQGLVSFGSSLMVAMKEEVPEGPHIQVMPSEIHRSQLLSLAEGLAVVVQMIQPNTITKDHAQQREAIIQQYHRQEMKEHMYILNRKSTIEARKEKIENIRNEQERSEREKVTKQQEKMRVAEETRLEEERKKRELERRQAEMKEIQKQQVWDRVSLLRGTEVGRKAFKDLTEEEIEEMDPEDILIRQQEQVDKEKREMTHKLRKQEKNIDHMARAMRMEEIPKLQEHYETMTVKDKELWDQEEEQRIQDARKEHEMALKAKARLVRMQGDKEVFLDSLFGNRHTEYQASLDDYEANLERVRQERLAERKKQRMAKRREEFIYKRREAKRKEREEQLQREKELEEERLRQEAEARRKAEEERRAHLDEMARKQRQKEEEAEAKLRARQQGMSQPDTPDQRDQGGWRRNEGPPQASPAPAQAPPTGNVAGGRYIPPSRRAAMNTSSGENNQDTWRGGRGNSDGPGARGGDWSGRGGPREGDRGDWNRGGPRDEPRADGGRGDWGRGDMRGGDRNFRQEPSRGDDRWGRDSREAPRDDPRGFRNDRDMRGGDRGGWGRDDRSGYGRRDDHMGGGGGGGRWRDGPSGDGGGGGGGSWRSGDGGGGGGRPEGRSWQASRARPDRGGADRGGGSEDRPRGEGDAGWTTVSR